ncbi:MAG: vitamin B12-dependent ribonucleotide reductase [Theionarchaea archaeon]|nr:vitamin B12-dependent ribonucleotide reductase [Theionarchaea archaeon]
MITVCESDTATPFDEIGNTLELSPNSMTVLEKRYLRKDENGNVVEIPEDMFRRVASNIASADRVYNSETDISALEEKFYEMMTNLEFLPNSPTLMNAGRDLQQLSACFVLPVEDSMESIFEAIKNTALIHKSGGGTGFSFSRLRPTHDVVHSTGGIASGPVSFMKVFDSATEAVKQGGTRRGANMAILRVDHPDIIEFITCKENDTVLNNFNISVGITESFMKAVEKEGEFEMINPRNGHVTGTISAKKIFDLMVKMAWKNGEPGIIFLDRINRDNPTPELGEIESTNPCGEQPLLPFESCNLGSINVSKVVWNGQIDYGHLKRTVHSAVHFLDNVIDQNNFPLEQMEKTTKGNRKVGLGIMGFADMLIKMGIPYDSEEALKTAEEIMKFISDEAAQASGRLARDRGPFPNFSCSTYTEEIRNATRTTIAPTGSLSIIANCSSGIEPLFAVSFVRKNILSDVVMVDVNPLFEEIAKERGFYTSELMEKIAQSGSVQGLKEVPPDVQRVFVTAHDITPEWHIRMQAAFQKYTDNAVSKTVNFPHSATENDVAQVFKLAYQLGCKGVTVYRDGSRETQVLNRGNTKKEEKMTEKLPRPRPELTVGGTVKVITGCGSLYVTINEDQHGLCEVFARMGKSGGCISSHSEAIGRLISLALRAGVETESIMKQLKGIRCPKVAFHHGEKVLSCADAIQIALQRYISNEATSLQMSLDQLNEGLWGRCPECPECGAMLEMQEGCLKCRSCGYSEC